MVKQGLFAVAMLVFVSNCQASGQDSRQLGNFQKVKGKHLELLTDLPLDADLEELPVIFDAAIPLWQEIFGVSDTEVQEWVCQGHVMLDRGRFELAGLIPQHLPVFPYGFQYGNQIWVSEQQSAYYRRHLVLHEGTHWFMNRKYGDNAPPWLMEGIAEWLGTHSWDKETRTLKLGVVPARKSDVPYWGRIKIIREALDAGTAPALESIMRYGNSAHQEVEAYAWSWAAVLFFREHPRTRKTFEKLLEMPLRPDPSVTSWFYRQLQSEWPLVRTEWQAMLTELDYGYTPNSGMLQITPENILGFPQKSEFELESSRSWQPTGFLVKSGERIRIVAKGSMTLDDSPRPWLSYADGVTLEYHEGHPVGRLMAVVAGPQEGAAKYSVRTPLLAAGSDTTITAPAAGELHFRVNEKASELSNNRGKLSITIERLE